LTEVHIYSPLPAMRIGISQVLRQDGRFSVHELSDRPDGVRHIDRFTAESTLIIDEGGAEIHRTLETADLIRRLQGRILIMSSVLDREHVSEVFAAGVGGFIDRAASETEILNAAICVSAGQTYLQPALGSRLMGTVPDDRPDRDPLDSLSEREREVIRLLALGHKQREIARELTISIRTVETHLLHIRGKLNVNQRADLVKLALASTYFSIQREPSSNSSPVVRRPFAVPSPVSGHARSASVPPRPVRGGGAEPLRPVLVPTHRYCPSR
jgi:two-component system response regulator NreC